MEAILDEQTVKIALKAPAMEGKANAELIAFLSGNLGIAKSKIEIIRGAATRLKHVRIEGNDQKTASELFRI
ncbi:MAG: hypothetical protein UY82_C0002G0004 [Candidatus Uhrbacteria bacterium GW2011_GWC2_53_7]|uniref:Uncharacterized protein n=1 Tax=Candidatus Uhrbacteria bacterium GW2011_GWC2_53_7 TaxID=1618986 RepID=A0A0G1Y0W5_9BACT|nr:MAG: hypothetical protein UY82_C0002G0004 [Candidatus Uhrbacteria bacterium GW2011_GWC2_53_7]